MRVMKVQSWFVVVFVVASGGRGGFVSRAAEAADAQDVFLTADPSQRGRMVRAPLEQASQSIRLDYQYVLSHTSEFMEASKGSLPDETRETGSHTTYVRIGSRTRTESRPLEQAAAGLKPAIGDPELKIYDGRTVLHWLPGKDAASSVGKAAVAHRPPRTILEDSGPAELFGLEEASVGDLLASDGVEVVPSDTNVLGARTLQVSGTMKINEVDYEVTYWLAPDRGFLALRAEIRGLAGHLVRSREVKAVKQLPNGAWWPTDIEVREFDDNPANPYHANTNRWTVGEVVLDPEVRDPEAFFSTATDWLPAGTYITDNVINEAYTVYGGAKADDVLDGIVSSFVSQEPIATLRGMRTRRPVCPKHPPEEKNRWPSSLKRTRSPRPGCC